ncbi:uncharacterized protein MONOS_18063 [Monocercomonoides exilis]|nr:hypothetical protein MONOS_18063 [Monocercomonoides exilis]
MDEVLCQSQKGFETASTAQPFCSTVVCAILKGKEEGKKHQVEREVGSWRRKRADLTGIPEDFAHCREQSQQSKKEIEGKRERERKRDKEADEAYADVQAGGKAAARFGEQQDECAGTLREAADDSHMQNNAIAVVWPAVSGNTQKRKEG